MKKRNNWSIPTILLILLILSLIYFISPQISFIIILCIIGISAIFTIIYPPAFWLILAVIFIVFESEQYRLGIFPLPLLQYSYIAIFNIMLVGITLYYFFIVRDEPVGFDFFDKLIYFFILGTVIAAGIGLIHGYALKAIGKDLGFVLGYFAFITMRRSNKHFLRIIPWVLSFAVVLLFIEYLYLARIVIASPYLLTTRVVTRQAVLSILAIPVGTSFMLWSNNARYKIIGSVLFIIFTPIIILSMQRALWIATLIGILVSVIAGFFSSKNDRKKALFNVMIVLLILAFIITAGIVVVNQFFSDNYLNLLNARMTSLQTVNNVVQDKSYQVRSGDMESVLKKIQKYPYTVIIGRGLGDRILRRFPFNQYIGFIDNTYLVILWKMGGAFLLLYLMIFFFSIRYFFRISLRQENNALAIGFIGFLLALLIFMLGTNLGMIYRFITVFWGLLGAGFAYYRINESDNGKIKEIDGKNPVSDQQ